MGFCKVCGAQIQDGVKFCTECGSPVAAAPDIQGSPSMSGTSQQVAQNQNFNSQSSGQQKQPENTADYKNDGWGVSMGDETMVLNEGWKTQMESGKKVGGDSWGQTNGGQSAPRGRKRSAQNNTAQSNTAQTNTTQQTGFDTSKGSQEPAGSASPFGYGSLSGAQGSSPNQFGYGSPSDSQGQTGSNPQTGAQNQFGYGSPQTGAQNQFGYGSPQTGAQNQFGYGNASGGQESAQNQFGYGNQTGSQNQFGYGAQPGSQGQFGAGGQGAAQPDQRRHGRLQSDHARRHQVLRRYSGGHR